MEFVDAPSLAALMQEKEHLDPQEVARIGAKVAAALAAAHDAGIVHRDVKPANILVADNGTVKITDFGISRAVGDVTVTSTGFLAGTPAYLSPEVARRGEHRIPVGRVRPGLDAVCRGRGASSRSVRATIRWRCCMRWRGPRCRSRYGPACSGRCCCGCRPQRRGTGRPWHRRSRNSRRSPRAAHRCCPSRPPKSCPRPPRRWATRPPPRCCRAPVRRGTPQTRPCTSRRPVRAGRPREGRRYRARCRPIAACSCWPRPVSWWFW